MDAIKLYEELFGGASRGAFAVKRQMKKAKVRFGDYTPEANPDPFAYDEGRAKAGKYSKHIQKKIGDVEDENVVPFKRRKISAEEREQNKRLEPKYWGIDKDDLQYNERMNRSFFKVAGQKGWFSFPPIKWKGRDGNYYYGLAHYAEKPPEDRDGDGGRHYDSIAFLSDSQPPQQAFQDFHSVAWTRNKGKSGSVVEQADSKNIRIGDQRLELHDGVFGTRKIDEDGEYYGYWIKGVNKRGRRIQEYEVVPPKLEISADAPLDERVKVWRQIVSMINQLDDYATSNGKANSRANYMKARHELRLEKAEKTHAEQKTTITDARGNVRTEIKEIPLPPHRYKSKDGKRGRLSKADAPPDKIKLPGESSGWRVNKKRLNDLIDDLDDYATATNDTVEACISAIDKNESLLDDLGYDGRFSLPSRSLYEPVKHPWDTPAEKEDKKKQLTTYKQKLWVLQREIKDGNPRPADWWRIDTAHYGQ
ncbi:hypothetical protein EBR66_06585 [bacterium]|nr:hypothetical protein [bacterium]